MASWLRVGILFVDSCADLDKVGKEVFRRGDKLKRCLAPAHTRTHTLTHTHTHTQIVSEVINKHKVKQNSKICIAPK